MNSQAFREDYPQVQVRVIKEGADGVLATVKRGDADLGLDDIGMQDPEVQFTPLRKKPYVLACAAGHALARRRSVRWSELADCPLARVSHASRNRLFIDQALADLPALPRPVCEVRHVSTLIGLVENGLGVAVVPRLMLPRKPATVVGVPPTQPPITRTLGVVRRSGHSLSPAAAAFERLLAKAGRQRLARA